MKAASLGSPLLLFGASAYTTAMAALAEVPQNTLAEEDYEPTLSVRGLVMPITLRFALPLSDESLLHFSQQNEAYRVERNAEGELEIMSPALFRGGQREVFAMSMLFLYAQQTGKGVTASSETGYKLGDTSIRCPDASWVSDERARQAPAEEADQFAPFCPNFLIEVRSSRESRTALELKMRMWISAGAELAWMIDPFDAEVLIYRPGAEPERLDRPDWVEADSVVTGFRLETARMWEE